MIAGPLVVLAACSPKPPPEPAAKPVVAVSSDFSKPMYARGSDPNWALTIRGTDLTFTRAGQADVQAKAPGAVIQPGKASWTATLPGGETLTATLYASDCIDPLNGTTYPFAAEVDFAGAAPFSGCAYKIN